ncbi:unnamed protein product [Miscanthus lutarioriparius]|uniref:Rab escort protein n=1 Tax=Miscanthus lutarioriparius TaxID=422564 RepID=A0A811PDQ9_9POAL|nr:unnamed protein product [Miscanthus lutarioriparius]
MAEAAAHSSNSAVDGGGGSVQNDYPTIDPTSFDVVLCGTGLPESVLAAACAAAGKTVLHVDPSPFYGSLYSSIPLSSLASFLSPEASPPTSSRRRPPPPIRVPSSSISTDGALDLLLRSGGSHHVEFKSVEGGSLLYWEGCLYPVPDSRQAIFKDTTLKLKEKNILFRVVLYAIAMADYDQDGADPCEKLITTREGIQTIALYSSSIGRFANAEGAFIYPMYGHGELPQAFCRCAAVKGALYVLRMPVAAVLMDEEKKHFVGARLASGQDILCQQLIFDQSYKIPTLDVPFDGSDSHFPRKVAERVCIISKSVKQGSSNVLVIFPPKSLEEQQVTAVRLLQLSSNLAVCPPGMKKIREHLYCHAPCLMNTWTTEMYWDQQKSYSQVSILMKSSYLKSQLLYMPMMTLILQSKTIFLEGAMVSNCRAKRSSMGAPDDRMVGIFGLSSTQLTYILLLKMTVLLIDTGRQTIVDNFPDKNINLRRNFNTPYLLPYRATLF